MNAFLEKVQQACEALISEKGDFLLLAFVELTANEHEWDIVLCADWLPKRKRAAIDIIVDKLEKFLDEDDFLNISRIIVLNKDDLFCRELIEIGRQSEDYILKNVTIAGLDVKEAIIWQTSGESVKSKAKPEFLSALKNNPQLLEYIDKIIEEKVAQKVYARHLGGKNPELHKTE